MYLVGLYDKVREVGPMGYGRPFMYKRSVSQQPPKITPYKGEYWDKTREGLFVPRIGGGIGFSGQQRYTYVSIPGFYATSTALSQSTLALDSNYVAGTSGDAISVRFVLPATKTFDSIYFFITAYTGTAANVNDISLEIREDAASGLPNTSATVDTDTVDPASATGWIVKQFATPQSLTGGTTYHAIVGDADGSGTDYATVLARVAMMQTPAGNTNAVLWNGSTTANGFIAASSLNLPSSICLKFSDNSILGNPFSTAETPASATLAKGLLISGLTEQLKLFGVLSSSTNANYSQVDVFAGTALSDSTPFATADKAVLSPTVTTPNGFLFPSVVTLAKSTQYRIVFRYSGSTNTPVKYNIGTGADATLKSAMFGGGSWYWTIDSAGPVWVDDDDAWPNMVMLVEDQVAVPEPPIYQLGI